MGRIYAELTSAIVMEVVRNEMLIDCRILIPLGG